ncbi:hypothetical protein H261_09028 [Paramagnetospirillum caucaseum]|uniref:Glycine zipper domain-containing protein n=1 Tax=Paramagnetospirillum caucaseum TaxID=1244869 RepID=M2ZSJ2_9PROT|nr:hypothetical protein [Paramagnetospirillum caucaseum]EME70317.1 hypothetical protein H261_09028 [Paramagnetospirillum caucaseum]
MTIRSNTPARPATALAAVVLAIALSGCANMTNQQQRALSGGAMGAAGGAAIAAMAGGGVVTGALIGAGGGGAIGALLPDNWTGRTSSSGTKTSR